MNGFRTASEGRAERALEVMEELREHVIRRVCSTALAEAKPKGYGIFVHDAGGFTVRAWADPRVPEGTAYYSQDTTCPSDEEITRYSVWDRVRREGQGAGA